MMFWMNVSLSRVLIDYSYTFLTLGIKRNITRGVSYRVILFRKFVKSCAQMAYCTWRQIGSIMQNKC